MSYSSTQEKVSFSFSLKNCLKGFNYSISILINDLLSGYKDKFLTEEVECLENYTEIKFSKKFSFNFYFEKTQKVQLKMSKKSRDNSDNFTRETSISNIIASQNSKYERIMENSKDKEILCIIVDRANNNIEKPYLFDYIKSGVKLSCFLSLDFSDSEKNPSLIDTKDNYIRILKKLSFIESYIKNHIYYSHGYGAKVLNFSKDESNFNLNLDKNDCSIKKNDGVIQSYENCLKSKIIKHDNKINLSSLIRKITREIYSLYQIRYYNVSFIITRSILDKNDISNTIDSIIESSYLPLTTFIIGVGNNDYTPMMKIFTKNYKTSSLGMQKMRNNVFFCSMIDDFSNDADQLITWCLKELHTQILSYYHLIKSYPQDIYENKLKNITESFNIYNSSVILDRSCLYDSEINKINQSASILLQGGSSSQNSSIKVSKVVSKAQLDSINPYKNDSQNLSSLSNSNKSSTNSNVDNIADNKAKKEEKLFKNKKVQKFTIIEETDTDKGDNEKYYIPKESVIDSNSKDKSYDKKVLKDKETDTGDAPGPAPSAIENEKFLIPANSIIASNLNIKIPNPYLDEFKEKDSENIEGSNYSLEIKKNNNASNASEFNSTKNSENIKTSNYLGNNNYSIDSYSHWK